MIISGKRPRAHASLPFCLLFSVALLTSCGPVYNTEYSYTPPKSLEGRSCINQCEYSKIQCEELENLRERECESRAELEYDRCRRDIYNSKKREPKWSECSRSSCSTDEERCERLYRSCYQACGGRVDSRTVCVANCDQIPPQGSTGSRSQGSRDGSRNDRGDSGYGDW
jgi:hypothetical protein